MAKRVVGPIVSDQDLLLPKLTTRGLSSADINHIVEVDNFHYSVGCWLPNVILGSNFSPTSGMEFNPVLIKVPGDRQDYYAARDLAYSKNLFLLTVEQGFYIAEFLTYAVASYYKFKSVVIMHEPVKCGTAAKILTITENHELSGRPIGASWGKDTLFCFSMKRNR